MFTLVLILPTTRDTNSWDELRATTPLPDGIRWVAEGWSEDDKSTVLVFQSECLGLKAVKDALHGWLRKTADVVCLPRHAYTLHVLDTR